jgi:hypothetical protein
MSNDQSTAAIIAFSILLCASLVDAVTAVVIASLVDAVTAVAIVLTGAGCGELDGDAETCRLSGALTAGEAGEAIVESVALGLRASSQPPT